MDLPQQASIWPVLLPVIAGGALALLGSLVGPTMNHFLNSRSNQQAKRLERLEALLTAVNEHDHWLEQKKRAVVFGEAIEYGPPPIAKAVALVSLYFPSLNAPLLRLSASASGYEVWMSESAVRKLGGDHTNYGRGMEEVFKPYRNQYHEFIRTVAEFSNPKEVNSHRVAARLQ